MRITEGMTYLSFISDLQQTQQQLSNSEIQVTSGKKVNKPSDDPAGAADIVRISAEQAVSDQYTRNLNAATSRLNAANDTLGSVQTMINRIVQLAESGSSTGANTQASVPELQGLREQMLSLANTQSGGRYIFGGSATTTQPYVEDQNGNVTYQGNSTVVSLQVGSEATVQEQIPGNQVFSGSVDIFSTMSQLITAMQSGDTDTIAAQVNQLKQFSDNVSAAQSQVGGLLNKASSQSSLLTTDGLAQATDLNNVQSADMAQAMTQLTLSQTNLEATLAVGARIAQINLLDYLH